MAQPASREERLALANIIDDDYAAIEKAPLPDMSTIESLNALRGMMNVFSAPRAPEDVQEERITVPARDGYQIPCIVHKPATDGGPGPLLVNFHGGGFVLGKPEFDSAPMRSLVQAYSLTVVNVDYRLAPEHPFPVGVLDCYDVLAWSAANAAQLGADPSKGFLVSGSSSGANMATACALRAKQQSLSPPVTGVALAIPNTMPLDQPPKGYENEYLSCDQVKITSGFNREAFESMEKHYKADPTSALYNVSAADLTGSPPHFIQVSGLDALRDDGLIFEKQLSVSGVRTRLNIYPGLPHGFSFVYPALKKSAQYNDDLVKGFGWLLKKGNQN